MESRKDSELRKEAETANQASTGNLAEAAKSVYRRYGTDLRAFFRDAYEAEARKRQEGETHERPNHNVEVCP